MFLRFFTDMFVHGRLGDAYTHMMSTFRTNLDDTPITPVGPMFVDTFTCSDFRELFGAGRGHMDKFMALFGKHGLDITIPTILNNQSTNWYWKNRVGSGSARYVAQEECQSFGDTPICDEHYTRVALVRLNASCNQVNDEMRERF